MQAHCVQLASKAWPLGLGLAQLQLHDSLVRLWRQWAELPWHHWLLGLHQCKTWPVSNGIMTFCFVNTERCRKEVSSTSSAQCLGKTHQRMSRCSLDVCMSSISVHNALELLTMCVPQTSCTMRACKSQSARHVLKACDSASRSGKVYLPGCAYPKALGD